MSVEMLREALDWLNETALADNGACVWCGGSRHTANCELAAFMDRLGKAVSEPQEAPPGDSWVGALASVEEPSPDVLAGPKTGVERPSPGLEGPEGLRFDLRSVSGHGFSVALSLKLAPIPPTLDQKFSKLSSRDALELVLREMLDDFGEVLDDQMVLDFLNALPNWQPKSVSSETGSKAGELCWTFHPGSEILPCVLPSGHSGDHQDARGMRWEP